MYLRLEFLLGGGFGGKETRSFYLSTAVAVAANKCVDHFSMYSNTIHKVYYFVYVV